MIYQNLQDVHGISDQFVIDWSNGWNQVKFLLYQVFFLWMVGKSIRRDHQIISASQERHAGLKIRVENIQRFVEIFVVNPNSGQKNHRGSVLKLIRKTWWSLTKLFLFLQQSIRSLSSFIVSAFRKKLENFPSDSVFFFVVIFYFICDTDALGSMWCPINFLMLRFAITNIKASTTEKFGLFSTQVTMDSEKFLTIILILLGIHFSN